MNFTQCFWAYCIRVRYSVRIWAEQSSVFGMDFPGVLFNHPTMSLMKEQDPRPGYFTFHVSISPLCLCIFRRVVSNWFDVLLFCYVASVDTCRNSIPESQLILGFQSCSDKNVSYFQGEPPTIRHTSFLPKTLGTSLESGDPGKQVGEKLGKLGC